MSELDSSSRWAVVDLRGAHRPQPGNAAGPLALVCGLPVLVRNLLLFQRAGLSTVVLLSDPADRSAVEHVLAKAPRVWLRVVWAVDLPELRRAVEGHAAELLYWPGALSFGRRLPALATANLGGRLGLLPVATDGVSGSGPMVIAAEALGELGDESGSGRAGAELPGLGDRLVSEGRAQRVPLVEPPEVVLDASAARLAEVGLLRSLRKPVDGAVAKFDRYISLAISRHLMRLPVTPNLVTILAGLLGVGCGLLAARGGYWPMLLAAIGFQLNSILDGIDGEIARAKLLESRLGQWLDTLADDSSNLCYSVGVCVGCFRTLGAHVYLTLAVATATGFIITAALMYRYIINVAHSGDLNDFKMPWEEAAAGAVTPYPPSGLAGLLARFKFVVRRDTFVFLSTCLALLGQLRVMAWLFAAGANAVWLSIVGYRVVRPALRSSPE
jgi:phosphatidylglycerophosphate synthase